MIPKVPLNLVLCQKCKLLQLEHDAPNESMWGKQYWYKSGINRLIREDLRDIVEKSQKLAEIGEGDLVIDIGCNDGTLLEFFDRNKKINLVGFEPSGNVAKRARKKGFYVIGDYFNVKSFKEKFGNKKAKLITAISMFYDLEDPNTFMRDIVSILDKEGLLVIQQNYVMAMLENNAFDNICHEHREYYSLFSLNNLLKKYDLEVFDIEQNDINGGSIRTYIKRKENTDLKGFKGSQERIDNALAKEKETGLDTFEPYENFAGRISKIKNDLLEFLEKEKKSGKKICALGASTRGNTTLQYFELGPEVISCIFDRNPDKEGKKTVGSLIPITSPENIQKYAPDYQLVLIWHIFKGIGEDEKKFVDDGGKFILPLPKLKITKEI